MPANYLLACYWNPNWLPKVMSTEQGPVTYPLECSLFVKSGTPVVEDDLFVPSPAVGSAAWQPVLSPGVWPAVQNAPGFQAGDTISFAFQMAGGSQTPPSNLTSSIVTFMRRAKESMAGTNPIGITAASSGTTINLEGVDYTKWSWECSNMPAGNAGSTYAQYFDVAGSSMVSGVPIFTFEDQSSFWVVRFEAIYGATIFGYDPEWKVGGGN